MNARDLLSDYAFGELDPEATAEVEALLASSAEARAELRQLQAALVRLSETLPPVTPPAGSWEQLAARIAAFDDRFSLEATSASPTTVPKMAPTRLPPTRSPMNSGWLGWSLAACLALVAVGEGLWLDRSQRASREVQTEARLVAAYLGDPQVERLGLQGRERERLGSVLTDTAGRALFVLDAPPPAGQSYQAWGHSSDGWEPGSSEQLTSLAVSESSIFEINTQPFVALYVSLEPRGGSVQPTFPLSRVSLLEPVPRAQLQVTSPVDGSTTQSSSVIVSGVVDNTVTSLSYVLNGETTHTATVGNRFNFTATLRPGTNTLVVEAAGSEATVTESLTLTRLP